MAQTLVIFGATGLQGGSVVNHVLASPELSRQYVIRAVTRDPESDKAKQLKAKGIDVSQGDVSDRSSLERVLTGAHTVFLMTTPTFGPDARQIEFDAAKRVADISVEKGAQFLIFSTLPSVSKTSGGKYTRLVMFDAKAEAEDYIRGLPIKSAFLSMSSFMENYLTVALPRRVSEDSTTFAFAQNIPPNTRVPLVDAGGDTGKFTAAILADPPKYEGKIVYGAVKLYSLEEIAATFAKVTGQDVVYKQLSDDELRARLPFAADLIIETFNYFHEFGYYGPDTDTLVATVDDHASGKLTTFEEFLEKHRPSLQ